jgi:hypothetical protein
VRGRPLGGQLPPAAAAGSAPRRPLPALGILGHGSFLFVPRSWLRTRCSRAPWLCQSLIAFPEPPAAETSSRCLLSLRFVSAYVPRSCLLSAADRRLPFLPAEPRTQPVRAQCLPLLRSPWTPQPVFTPFSQQQRLNRGALPCAAPSFLSTPGLPGALPLVSVAPQVGVHRQRSQFPLPRGVLLDFHLCVRLCFDAAGHWRAGLGCCSLFRYTMQIVRLHSNLISIGRRSVL